MLSPSVTVTVQAQELLRAHRDGRLAHEAVAAIPAVFDLDSTTGSQRLTRKDQVIGVATIWVL